MIVGCLKNSKKFDDVVVSLLLPQKSHALEHPFGKAVECFVPIFFLGFLV